MLLKWVNKWSRHTKVTKQWLENMFICIFTINPTVLYSLRADQIGQHEGCDQYNNNMFQYKQPYKMILFESIKLVQKWWVYNHNMHKKKPSGSKFTSYVDTCESSLHLH